MSEEETPERCPSCRSLNTTATVDDANRPVFECLSCGAQWADKPAPPPGDGPWRVGKTIGRTLYFQNQIVGLADTPELATALTTAANVASKLFSDARMERLVDLVTRFEAYSQLAPASALVAGAFALLREELNVVKPAANEEAES